MVIRQNILKIYRFQNNLYQVCDIFFIIFSLFSKYITTLVVQTLLVQSEKLSLYFQTQQQCFFEKYCFIEVNLHRNCCQFFCQTNKKTQWNLISKWCPWSIDGEGGVCRRMFNTSLRYLFYGILLCSFLPLSHVFGAR